MDDTKTKLWMAIWAALERVFADLPLVIRHKSKRQDAIAEKHLQEASAAMAEATMALQSALERINTQTDHLYAVHLSRFLNLASPLLAELQACFGRSSGGKIHMPVDIAKAIDRELSQINDIAVHRYLRGILTEHTVGDALAVLSDEENGVGQVVIGLQQLRDDPVRAGLAQAYVTSLGELSVACDEVEIGPGVAIGIGDMPTSYARILLAQRYLAAKGAW